jgi:hypothetical protein
MPLSAIQAFFGAPDDYVNSADRIAAPWQKFLVWRLLNALL